MAFLQARAGVARSGVTYAGLSTPYWRIDIGGVDRTGYVEYEGFAITHRLDGTSSLTMTLKPGLTPAIGQTVSVLFARPDEYLFKGTVLGLECSPFTPSSDSLVWHVTAVGEEWLLDRYDRVLARYRSTGVGTIVADILDRFTDGGFRVGYCPQTLGNQTIEFQSDTVVGALNRLAAATESFWTVKNRVVDLYDEYPSTALPSLTNSSQLNRLSYGEDGTQLQTRKLYRGRGAAVLSLVAAGSTTIAMSDVSMFSASGGSATSGQQAFTYTGKSIGSGAGLLTGVSGLVDDIAEGDEVSILVESVDVAAQSALATLLGGGLSGQVTDYLADGRLSEEEAQARADADVSSFGTAVKAIEYSDTRRDIHVGRKVTASITSPLSVSGTFRIQVVSITPRGIVGGRNIDQVWRRVSASRVMRRLTELLKQLPG